MAALLGTTTGCFEPTGLGLDMNCCAMGGGGNPNYPLWLSATDNMLRGDTIRILTFASSGDTRSTWELTGPAVFVLGDSTSTRITTPVADALVRASGSGAVTVRAARAGTTESAFQSFFVADPSEVILKIVQGRNTLVRVGAESWVAAHLLDATGRYYRGPVAWTSSDTSKMILIEGANISPFGKFARGRAAGSAYVVVSFLQRRDTALVEIVP